jgi:acetyl-CoA C-acetyltransferase
VSERVAIVALAQTRFTPKDVDRNYAELSYEVVDKVLAEANLDMHRDIDNSVTCSQDIWDGQTISNIGVTDVVGGHLRNEEKVAMDGAAAVYYGMVGILSGEFDCTLLLAHTKMSQTNRNVVNNIAFDPLYTRQLGFDFTSAAALQAKRYMHSYNISEEDIARVTLKNLQNAIDNPNAHNKGTYTLNDILGSPMIADPIRAMQVSPDTDGAVAMILASEKKVKEMGANPVWIKGIGSCYDAHYLGDRDLADVMALQKASTRAYKMAGITDPASQINLVELSDEFSYQELMWLEGLGICSRGQAGEFTSSGRSAREGEIPVNASGGLLSGVPANVMGLNRVAEAASQIMGTAGASQVPNVKMAVAQGHTGICGQHQCVIVLGQE